MVNSIGSQNQLVKIWTNQKCHEDQDQIAREVPVALVYNDISHVVMMATPTDLEAFAIGFSLSEKIIKSVGEVYSIEVSEGDLGIEISLKVSNRSFEKLKERRRNSIGRTGCGVCGVESLKQIELAHAPVLANCELSHAAIDAATRLMENYQPLQSATGAVHGAAWCDEGGNILKLLEDVGRHNALDKLIGNLALEEKLTQQELNMGFALVSSRASYEMVQKVASVNISVLVAVSAPTNLAINLANKADLTLVGFARDGRHICYTNAKRLKSA